MATDCFHFVFKLWIIFIVKQYGLMMWSVLMMWRAEAKCDVWFVDYTPEYKLHIQLCYWNILIL